MRTLADAFLRIRPDMSRVGPEIRRGTEAPAAEAGKNAGHHFVKNMARTVAAGAALIAKVSLGAFGAAMAVGAAAEAAKFAGVFLAKTAAILGPGLAAIAALVPAAIGAAALAVGTLKIALAGFGDAVKAGLAGDTEKFNKAIEGMHPAAAQAARVVAGLRPQLDAVKRSVQGAFFGPFVRDLKPLASSYLPMLGAALTVIARGFGRAAAQVAVFLRESATTKAVSQALKDMAAAVGNVAAGIPGIVKGLVAVVTAGASFLPGLTEGFGALADRFGAFMTAAAQSGALHDFISGGLSGLGDLVQLFGELYAITHAVLGAAIDAGLLDALSVLGDAVKTLVTAAGPGLAVFMKSLIEGLTLLAPAAGPVGAALGSILASLGPLLPIVGELAAALLTGLAPALAAVVGVVASVVGWFNRHRDVALDLAIAIGALVAVTEIHAAVMAVQAAGGLLKYLASMNLVKIATGVWTAVQWLLNIALTANPIGLVIVGIGLLVAAIVWIATKTTWFQDLWRVVWTFVKDVAGAVANWFMAYVWRGTLKPAFDAIANATIWMKDKVVGAWQALQNFVTGVHVWLHDRVFQPLVTLVTSTIPDAFRRGVEAVGGFWDRLKSLAAVPVRFVVETVINQGIIGTFNQVSGFFGGPKFGNVSLPAGIGDGPGPAGARTGDGPGDVLGFLGGPAKWITDRVGLGDIAARFGNNPFAQLLTGAGTKLKDALVAKAMALIGASSDPGGGGGSVGGLQAGIAAVLATLRAMFGNVAVISGFRPNSRTLTGNVSYHASGRAIDIAPVHSWAVFLNAMFGSRLRELITPWNELNIHNGQPHQYTGAVWNQHNFPGGNAHIHAAMYGGGVINEPIFGVGASGRTYSFGERGVETVVPGRVGGADPRAIRAALEGMAVVLDGVRVGQLQGRYADLLQRGG